MRRRHALGPLLALAALTAFAPAGEPVAALGGVNGGGNFDCTPAPPSVITQFTTPKQISGTAGLQCPTPGAQAPGQFGPGGNGPGDSPGPPTVGTACHFRFETPVQFRSNNGVPQLNAEEPIQSAPGTFSADPLNPVFVKEGWIDTIDWGGGPGVPPPVATANGTIYQQAGTTDFFYAWTFDGTWENVGGAIKCVASPDSPTNGWNTTCTAASDLATSCFDPAGPTAPVASGPMPVGGLNVDLNAFLTGQFFGGTITSRPNKPNPGLTNVPTCFYVSGMTVNGRAADPQQDVFWERIVQGPDIGEGRHIYFVFVIDVALKETVWDFGDGQTATIPKGGSSPDPVPSGCTPIANQQFVVAHTYHRYSTGDGFHVTVTNRYAVNVSELWRDTVSHRLDFPDVVPPVDVPSLPLPAFTMPIVQEEGVPVG